MRHRSRYKLTGFGALVGACAAVTAIAYRFTLSYAEEVRRTIFSLADSPLKIAGMFVLFALIGVAVGRVTQGEPLIKGSGIPQVEGQLLGFFSPQWLPVLVKKFICGAACIVCGLSLGREGPSIQLGAMTAQGMCDLTGRSRVERKYLIVCGACAGLAAAFNAPLAGVMFGLEEVHKNFSSRAMLPAMVAAISADVISKLMFGVWSTLSINPVGLLPIKFYFLYILIGALTGLFGAFYNRTLLFVQGLYAKLPVPLWARIVIPFICAGIIGFQLPEILGGGHSIIEELASYHYALDFMAVLLVGKFLFSMICFCSGAPGGIFFPLLVLGALSGAIFAESASILIGLPQQYVINFMLMGMAGMFAGIVRAPLTGIILVVEMSGSLTQLIGLSIVSCVSWLVADLTHSRPIYESLLDNMTPDSVDNSFAGEQNIIDVVVSYSSRLSGRPVKEIEWPSGCLIVCVNRGNEQIVPRGETVLEPGDVLNIACPVGDEGLVRSITDTPADEQDGGS